jgi:putative peptidoglycan lipid II flippase
MVKIFASTFYANRDTKTPVKIAIACVCTNLFFNLTLMGPMQYVGLALSTSIAGWVNAVALCICLRKRGLFVPDSLFKFRMVRMGVASLAMGLVLWLVAMPVAGYFQGPLVLKVIALSAVIMLGFTSYVALLFALKVAKAAEIHAYLRKK